MELLLVSLVAGALTILAPCVLPLLPIIVGGSLGDEKRPWKPYIITGSLALSLFLFTLLLRASTALLGVPPIIWQLLSGAIITLLGVITIWPHVWERVGRGLNSSSNVLLGRTGRHQGIGRDIATGMALGPVFSSCSPTYAFILAVTLPRAWAEGIAHVAAYTLGLSAMLLVVALGGQNLVGRLGWASNPNGWFKRSMGVIFIVVGIAIILGLDKDLQTFILDHGWYAPVEQFERSLRP